MDVLARSRNKHICLGFCLKPSIGPSYRKVLSISERGVCPRGLFCPWARWDRGLAKFRNCSGVVGVGVVCSNILLDFM